MHNGQKVVDVHGHMTTPRAVSPISREQWAQNTPGRKLEMTDGNWKTLSSAISSSWMIENIDVQLIGPRPIAMWHWDAPVCRTSGPSP